MPTDTPAFKKPAPANKRNNASEPVQEIKKNNPLTPSTADSTKNKKNYTDPMLELMDSLKNQVEITSNLVQEIIGGNAAKQRIEDLAGKAIENLSSVFSGNKETENTPMSKKTEQPRPFALSPMADTKKADSYLDNLSWPETGVSERTESSKQESVETLTMS